MSATVADFLLERLSQHGVSCVYGCPGEGLAGILASFPRSAGRVEFVSAPQDEQAAFMACAHAKFSRDVGVCMSASGPAAIQLLNGLYDARMDHQPVLAIVGHQKAGGSAGGGSEQEVDLLALYKDVAHEFIQTASTPEQVQPLIDRALQIARDRRAVTCVIIPADVQEMAAPVLAAGHQGRASMSASPMPHTPPLESLLRAAEVLNSGRKVALLVGAGALHSCDEIIAVADRLGAGIAKALLGKAAVPDDLPIVTGSLGMWGTQPSAQMMQGCDTLLVIGSSFPHVEFLPPEGQARTVQIDIDPRFISVRYPTEVGLVGDSRATLAGLLPLLERQVDRSWQTAIEQNVRQWWEMLEVRAHVDAHPVNPQRVFRELSPRLPDNAIIAVDTGDVAVWYARDVKLRRGMMASLSGGMASAGTALPYAIAAKHAHPQRPVIALVGDSAMQGGGVNGLIAVAGMWQSWQDKRMVIMVLNGRDPHAASGPRRAQGAAGFEMSSLLPEFPYSDFAKMLGLHGLRVDHPDAVGPAWAAALRASKPVVLEMVIDPEVAALPPAFDRKQLQTYVSALLHGDAVALQSMKSTMKQWWVGKFASLDARH